MGTLLLTILLGLLYLAAGMAAAPLLEALPKDPAAQAWALVLRHGLMILSQALFFFAAAFLFTGTRNRDESLTRLGFRKTKLPSILLALAAAPSIAPLAFFLSALSPVPGDAAASSYAMASGFLGTGISLAALILFPAVCEETLFRGFLQGGLQRSMPAPWAALVSTLLFSLFHGMGGQALGVLPLGLFLAYLFSVTGSLFPGMAFHAAYNALALAAARAPELPSWIAIGGRLRPWTLIPSIILMTILALAILRAGRAAALSRSPSSPAA